MPRIAQLRGRRILTHRVIVEVHFRGRALRRHYERSAEAARGWGPEVGRRYVERVGVLMSAERVADHTLRALGLHPLTGDRAGLHALR